ncbi:hypothetical protein Tco_1147325 [Tanacetum coccineum]
MITPCLRKKKTQGALLYLDLNDLDTPLEPETNQDVDFEPTVVNEPDNDKDVHEGKSPAGALTEIPVFVGKFSILTGFIIIDDEDVTRDVTLGMPFFMKYVSCQKIIKKFAHRDKCKRIMDK